MIYNQKGILREKVIGFEYKEESEAEMKQLL
jgi:hypothetical protein